MAGFDTARVNFGASFITPELDVTVMQLDRGLELLLRIQVVNRIAYGSELHRWWRGGWTSDGWIDPTWTGIADPWRACEYWGPVQRPETPPAKFCGSCGTQRTPGGRFCGSCESPFIDAQSGGVADLRADMQRAVAHPSEAGELVARLIDSYSLADMPADQRRTLGEKMSSLLANAGSKRFIDGVGGGNSQGVLTLASAQDVGGKARREESLARDRDTVELLLTRAPLTFGYWGPFKSLLKYMDPASHPEAFGVALGRLSSDSQVGSDPQGACEDLSVIANLFRIPGTGTLDYMRRRMRRRLAELAVTDPRTYAVVSSSMLAAWDARVHGHSFIPAYVVLGGAPYLTGDSRRVELSVDQSSRRDAHPEIWDEQPQMATALLDSLRRSVEAFTFACQVADSNRLPVPDLTEKTVPLALASTDRTVAERGQAALATTPGCWDTLSFNLWTSFLMSGRWEQVNATVTALLGHVRIPAVASAAHTGLLTEAAVEEARLADLARLYLAYTAPDDTGYRQRPTSSVADVRAVRVLALTLGFERTPQVWQSVLSAVSTESLTRAYVEIAADERATAATLELLVGLIEQTVIDTEIRSLAIICLSSPSPRAVDLGGRLIGHAQDRRDVVSSVWSWLRGCDLPPDRKLPLVLALLTLADSTQANELLAEVVAGEGWGFDAGSLIALLQNSPEAARVLWRTLSADDPGEAQRLVLSEPALVQAVGDGIGEADLASLTRSQAQVLSEYVLAHPDRIHSDTGFGVRLACAPYPDLQRVAIEQLAGFGGLARSWLVLAESALPLPLAAARGYVEALRDRTTVTQAVLAAIDSHVAPVRDMGLNLLDARRDVLDEEAVWTALLESDDPVVQARVAEESLARAWPLPEGLGAFDRRVLVTRRVNRRAKEQVKERLAARGADPSTWIQPARLDALHDMADGCNVSDREWALRRLAMLHLAGVPVDGVQVSTISRSES